MGTRRKKGTLRLVTGFPGTIASSLVRQIAKGDPRGRIVALVHPSRMSEARKETLAIGEARIELRTGDVSDMHLGLSGEEYEEATFATEIFHVAGAIASSIGRAGLWQSNVEGTRTVLELAKDCARLRRLVHFSSVWVCGQRVGVIAEDELDHDQGFRGPYEESKHASEKLVRTASSSLPITIVRPSSVVGDRPPRSDALSDGPYYLGLRVAVSPLSNPLPLPIDGSAPLHVVPADYVSQVAWLLSKHEDAVGLTFHLVDPHPPSLKRAYQSALELASRRPPKAHDASALVRRLPVIDRWLSPVRSSSPYLNQLSFFDSANTARFLERTRVRCPPFSSYLDAAHAFVGESTSSHPPVPSAIEDSLDHEL